MDKIFLQNEYKKIFSRIVNGDNITVLRYGDGERAIMTGEKVVAQEGWSSEGESPLAVALRESLNFTDDNVYYGISCPCCDRPAYYWYSTRIASKQITFANLFVNSNYQTFKSDFLTLTRDAIVIANHAGKNNRIGNLNVLKYYAVGDDCISCWEEECGSIVSRIISEYGSRDNLLYVVSAGPMAEPIIAELYKHNPNNCYIDFGSSIDICIHGSDTRPYSKPGTVYSKRNCWMFDPNTADFDVSVVLTTYKKPESLTEQLAAIDKQTLRPREIRLFKDAIDGFYSIDLNDEFLSSFDDCCIAKCNRGVWGRFDYARECKSKYVCLFDDDTIPGDCWLESCHFEMMQHEGIYGTIGIVLENSSGYPIDKRSYYRVGWAEPNEQLMEVDFVGHSWFLPRRALDYMFENTEQLQQYKVAAEDMTLSAKALQYGLSTFVPPHPYDNKRVWGSDSSLAMHFGQASGSLSMNVSNLRKMESAIVELTKTGASFLFQRNPGLVKMQKRILNRYHNVELMKHYLKVIHRKVFRRNKG